MRDLTTSVVPTPSSLIPPHSSASAYSSSASESVSCSLRGSFSGLALRLITRTMFPSASRSTLASERAPSSAMDEMAKGSDLAARRAAAAAAISSCEDVLESSFSVPPVGVFKRARRPRRR